MFFIFQRCGGVKKAGYVLRWPTEYTVSDKFKGICPPGSQTLAGPRLDLEPGQRVRRALGSGAAVIRLPLAASQTAIPESLAPPSGIEKNCFFHAGAHGKEAALHTTPQNPRTLGEKGGDTHLTTAKNHARPCQFTALHQQRHCDQVPKA